MPNSSPGIAQPVDDAAFPRVAVALSACLALQAGAATPVEARAARILAGMTLEQKVGQMTQAEIGSITPEQVTRWHIGSVLNGGGSWPAQHRHADAAAWLRLANALHLASLAGDAKVPLIWGTDAVHGHNNLYGATVFPHNIGLGAANDATLVEAIGEATARAVRATGIAWTFAPTLAVVQDPRWGRSYESYSASPAIVARLGAAAVRGLQRGLGGRTGVVATAKHFVGDGGTEGGVDQGVTRASEAELMAVHGAGHRAALDAGVQTVMASFNSWADGPKDPVKLHGSHRLLTEVLKQQLGFDGFVVSDWDGIGQVPGCSDDACAAAINAGVDMVMVPRAWRAFITNTLAQVRRGEIPESRIDDAVLRILRVKLRAGLFDQAPGDALQAGDDRALQARELARRAVRESLVLLKNDGAVLPLARSARLLVVGASADSLARQCGGWSLTWQGDRTTNADFPAGDTVLGALREVLGTRQVHFSADGLGVDVRDFDAVLAVIGETPYAEGEGDIHPGGQVAHSARFPQDLAVLRRVSGFGRPVVTVMISGRPVIANDLFNLSDAFVAAWLPGTEGGGIADLLLRDERGQVAHDFHGRLPLAWPRCTTLSGATGVALFGIGEGLSHARPRHQGPVEPESPTCEAPPRIQ
jgi:beta-glucosidase